MAGADKERSPNVLDVRPRLHSRGRDENVHAHAKLPKSDGDGPCYIDERPPPTAGCAGRPALLARGVAAAAAAATAHAPVGGGALGVDLEDDHIVQIAVAVLLALDDLLVEELARPSTKGTVSQKTPTTPFQPVLSPPTFFILRT